MGIFGVHSQSATCTAFTPVVWSPAQASTCGQWLSPMGKEVTEEPR